MPPATVRRRPEAAAPRAAVPGRRRGGVLLRHESRALLRVAVPLVFSQLGAVAMTTTDTIMVGPLGPTALAAAGLASAIQMVALMFCTGTIMGMTTLVSHAAGAGDVLGSRRALGQGLLVALGLSVPQMVVLLLGRPIALALGQAPDVAELAGGFMRALAFGVAPFMVFYAFRQFLEGTGRTGPSVVITFLGVAANVVGNRLLIFGVPGHVPAFGVVGSGWSTTAARWGMMLAIVGYLAWRGELGAGFRVPRPDPALMRRILRVGLPIGGQVVAEVGIFSLAAVMMGWMGKVELASHQVAINIASTTFMVALGSSIAGSIRVGLHVGAGSRRGVRRAAIATYLVALSFMAVCALVFLLFPAELIGLYSQDPRILRVGVRLMLLAAAFQVFDGAQVAGLSVLRGTGDTRIPMLITLVGYWVVGFPVAYILGFHTPFGPAGIWAGLVAALAVVALLLFLRVRRVIHAAPRPLGS
ncbi:MAG: efflux family protein [Gemmatimonadetes bacterium]|nr:efflux family protein [Gemmatimonadota bacterium]